MRFVGALAVILSGCVPTQPSGSGVDQNEELLAALFDDARSIEAQLARDLACVSIRRNGQDSDPPQPLIKRLAQRWSVPVVPGSRCRIVGDRERVVAEGASGTGKWLRVDKLECSGPDRCTADVHYYVANMGSGGRSVVAERTSTGWRTKGTGRAWIS